jgi:hypothetical protein
MTAALMAGALALLTACGGSGDGEVSRSTFEGDGKTWPLTVDSGTLVCEAGSRVTFTTGGTTYALNGLAKGDGQWSDVGSIWADDGSGLGLKVDMSDLTEAGLALCN